MESLDDEIKMLEHMKTLNFKLPEKNEQNNNNKPKIENVVILPNKRQDLQKQVFKTGYSLPTMTLEEWAEHIEKQNEQIKQNQPAPTKEQLEREKRQNEGIPEKEDESDEKVERDRSFDDWKDSHGKGEGNKNDNYFKRT